MTDTPQFTPDKVVEIFFATKAELEAMSKRHEAEMAPLSTRMDVAKAWLLDYLNKQGLDNAKTSHGLVYRSVIMSATVDPEGGWDLLLKHIFQRGMTRVLDAIERGENEGDALSQFMTEPSLSLFNHSVNKTAVKESMEQGVTVPGVKIAHVVQLNVRKS